MVKSRRAKAFGQVPAEPGLEGDGVPGFRARGPPGGVERDLPRHAVEAPHREAERGERDRVGPRDGPAVAPDAAAGVEDVVAGGVGLVGLDAELGDERGDPILAGADPLPAEVDRRTVGELGRVDAAADAIARLEHDDALPGLDEPPRRAQAAHPGAHHHAVGDR